MERCEVVDADILRPSCSQRGTLDESEIVGADMTDPFQTELIRNINLSTVLFDYPTELTYGATPRNDDCLHYDHVWNFSRSLEFAPNPCGCIWRNTCNIERHFASKRHIGTYEPPI
jgi:hypothetical protein